MRSKLENDTLTLYLEGHVGVGNSQAVEDELMGAIAANPGTNVVIDVLDRYFHTS